MKCKWDKSSKIITLICVCLSFYVIYLGLEKGGMNLIICTCVAVLLYTPFLFRPINMIQQGNELFINMLAYGKQIDLRDYEIIPDFSLKGSFRIFATGGLAGYMGVFYSSENGLFYSYLTSRNEIIALRNRETGKIICINKID